MAAAARLGYQTNLAARALVLQRSGLIGIVVAGVADAMLANVLQAAQCTLAARGYGALIICLDPAAESWSTVDRGLIARGVEGVLYVGGSPDTSALEALANAGVRWAAVSEREGGDGMRINCGRRRGAELAARYLLELGHERFGVVSQRLAGTGDGVVKALEGTAASLVVAESPRDGDPNGARAAVKQLLDVRPAPSAIVCSSDEEALAAVGECSIRGMAVPRELSIVGFGDATFARYAIPALTTVRVLAAEVGLRSAEALLESIAGRVPQPWEAPVKLAIRETSGAPPD